MGNHTATRARGRSSGSGGTASSAAAKLEAARQRVADAEANLRTATAALRASQGDMARATVAFGAVSGARDELGTAQEALARAEGRKLGPGEKYITREDYLAGKGVDSSTNPSHTVTPEEARAYLANPTPRGGAASASTRAPSSGPTPREREAESRAKAAESRATAAERRAAQLERQLATLQAQHEALKARVAGERVSGGRGAGARPARPSRASADVSAIPRPDSQLRRLDDPTNPVEAWRAFGGTRASLRSVLIDEPAGVLEAMARRAGNPGAKMPRLVQDQAVSRERLANYIAEQMAARFAQ